MAIAATTGRKIAVVARLLVNSVRKITSPVAAIIMKIIPIDEMGRRDSPSHKARPDFATAGKEETTVAMMLSHTSPVPHLRDPIKAGGIADWDYMVDRVAAEAAHDGL